MEALLAEERRLHNACSGDRVVSRYELLTYSYMARGRYVEQLLRYFRYFPREQILILQAESFFADPRRTLSTVYSFLNVNEGFSVQKLTPLNVGKNRKPVDADATAYLDKHLRPTYGDLYEMVGQDYGW